MSEMVSSFWWLTGGAQERIGGAGLGIRRPVGFKLWREWRSDSAPGRQRPAAGSRPHDAWRETKRLYKEHFGAAPPLALAVAGSQVHVFYVKFCGPV
jgi:hypothetical protein